MALLQNKPCQFYGCQKYAYRPSLSSRWTLALSGSNFSFRSLNELPVQMALLQNKPCQFYGRQKIYLQTKFELSKLILALSGPNFLFRPLNKLGPLVDNFKIAISGRAHPAQDNFSQVWSTSVNFKDNFPPGNYEPRITHIRPRTLKRKSGCPTGINKGQNSYSAHWENLCCWQ